MLVDCCLNLFLRVLCRARGRPDQRRTGTPCGMLGAPGVNVPEPVEGVPHTPSDDVSVPSKTLKFLLLRPVHKCLECGKVKLNTG